MITGVVRENKSNGQKTVTIPVESPIYKGDTVMITKLEDPTQMNNDKEVIENGRDSTRDSGGVGYDSSPGTKRE